LQSKFDITIIIFYASFFGDIYYLLNTKNDSLNDLI